MAEQEKPEGTTLETISTVAADEVFTKVYGTDDPELSGVEAVIQAAVRANIAENYPDVDANDFTIEVTGRKDGESVGEYAYHLIVNASGDYNMTADVTAKLIVTPAPLQVTVEDVTLTQGDPIPTAYDVTSTEPVNGDNVADVLSVLSFDYTTTYTPSTPAGSENPIDLELGGLPEDHIYNNYIIKTVPGRINVVAEGSNGGNAGKDSKSGKSGKGGNGGNGGSGSAGGEAAARIVPAGLTSVPSQGPVAVTTFINSESVPMDGTLVIGDASAPGTNYAAWALLNLILTIVTALTMIALFVTYFINRRDEDEDDPDYERNIKKYLGFRLITIAAAIIAALLFVLTEDMSLTMTFTDQWTVWHVVITAAAIILAFFSRKKYEEEELGTERA